MLVLTKLIKYVFKRISDEFNLNDCPIGYESIVCNNYKFIAYHSINNWLLEYNFYHPDTNIKLTHLLDESTIKLSFVENYNVNKYFVNSELIVPHPFGKLTINLNDSIFIEKCHGLTQWANLI